MILDSQNLFSDDQAITATAPSDNVIDLGAPGTPVGGVAALVRDLGKGVPLDILVQVVEAFTSGLATTLTITLEVDNDEAFGSAKTVWTSGAIAKADLVAGYRAAIQYVPEGVDERYVRLNYTVATGPFDTGKLAAGLVFGRDTNR